MAEISKVRFGGVDYDIKSITDTTLSEAGVPADAKAVENTRQAMNMVANNVYSYSSTVPEASANGWRLHESNGLCYAANDYKLVKYKVNPGDVIKVVCDDRWQFQNSAAVPSSGNANRIGITGGVYDGLLSVPDGATYIVLSSLKTSDATSISTVSDKVSSISTAVEDNKTAVNEALDMNIQLPVNRVDPDAVITGRYIYNGTIDQSTSYKTTDYIAVNNGDVLRLFKTTNNDGEIIERTTGERLAIFDADKNYLGVSGQYPCNINTGYTVENESARFVRVSYSASFNPVELTVNTNPNKFTNYEPPYYSSARLKRIESIIGTSSATKIIDCWGDSRTDMSDDGTSFPEYLNGLLGAPWIVSNRGVSGQASGQVSARYGSNEIYLTLENNTIPANGNAPITSWKPTTGTDTNLRGGDSTYGVHGTLNGIPGKYIHTTGGNIYFARDYEGNAVKVKPNTKLIPDQYFNAEHCQILWCGKNDFSYAYPNVVVGIESNYDGMIAKISHDKFLILGETYSVNSGYAEGTGNRDKVDTINSDLLAKYPNNFIDIQARLIAEGLTLEEITPTSKDEENIAGGFIPDSLMYDETHPNQYGREAIAKIIYAWMQEKGWL